MEENDKRPSKPIGPGRRMMGGGPPAAMRGVIEKPKNFKDTLKKLIKYLSKYKLIIIIVMIFAIASTIFHIFGPKVLGDATTLVYEGVINMLSDNGLGMDFDGILKIVTTVAVLYVLSAIFSYLQTHLMVGVTSKVVYDLRKNIHSKIDKLPLSYFDKKSHGEVLSYITNDIDTIAGNLSQGLTTVITAVATIIGMLVMMFSISWQMTIAALMVLPISFGVISFMIRKSQKYFKEQQEYIGHVNGHVEEMYSNHILVKAFNGEKKSIEDFNEYNDTLYKTAWKSQFITGLTMPIMHVIGNLGYVVICVLGGTLVTLGKITVGNIQSFIQYMRQFTQPINQVAQITSVLQSTTAAAERVFEFLEEEEEVKDTENPADIENIIGNVEFKNLRFGYIEDKIVIKDFSAKVEPGHKIAIVGPTGARKNNNSKIAYEIL